MWESHSAPNAGNVKLLALRQQKLIFFGAKGFQRGPDKVSRQFFCCWCAVWFSKIKVLLQNVWKGLTEKTFFFFERSPRKEALFWAFVQKRLLFPSTLGRNALILFCLFCGGMGVGNFSHRFENGGQTTFEKHGLDKETEERYIDRATLFDCTERKYVRCKETERNN